MKSIASVLPSPFQALIIFVVGFGPIACSAGIVRHDREMEDYRKLGQLKVFRCVARVGIKPLGHPVKFGGTAVLIAPQWVLTAGHVGMTAPLKRLRFQFGEEEYRATRRVPHPDFAADWEKRHSVASACVDGTDLALVQLDHPVPKTRPAIRYRDNDEVGEILTKVGYGAAGDGKAGLKRPLTLDRCASNNVIDAAGAKIGKLKVTNRVLLFDFDDPDNPSGNQLGDASPLELEGAVSKGDSGGGWFIENDGKWMLVAITSRRLSLSGDLNTDPNRVDLYYGAIGVGMRVSTANAWIDEVIGR